MRRPSVYRATWCAIPCFLWVLGCSGSGDAADSAGPIDGVQPDLAGDNAPSDGVQPPDAAPDAAPADTPWTDPASSDPGVQDTPMPLDGQSLGWGLVSGTAAATGTVTGFVTNVATGDPLEGIWVGTQDASIKTQTDALGAFSLDLPAGRLPLFAWGYGYLTRSTPIGVGTAPLQVDFALQPQGDKVTVPVVSGAAIDKGTARLAFPPFSFPVDLGIYLNWMTDDTFEAAPGPFAFTGSDGKPARITGVLSVGLPTTVQPQQAVEVRLPVPEGTTVDDVRLYDLVGGGWSLPTPPTRIEDGFAYYNVTHFSDKGQAVLASPAMWVVVSAKGDIRTGDGTPLVAGMVLATGTTVITGVTGRGHVQDPTQSLVYLSPNSTIQLNYREDPTKKEYETSMTDCVYGAIRMVVVGSDSDHTVKTKTDAMGVRGTVLTVSAADCPPGGADPAACKVEVTEGEVETYFQDASQTVSKGESLGVCPNVPVQPDSGPRDPGTVDPGPKDPGTPPDPGVSFCDPPCVAAPCYKSATCIDGGCVYEGNGCDDGLSCTMDVCAPGSEVPCIYWATCSNPECATHPYCACDCEDSDPCTKMYCGDGTYACYNAVDCYACPEHADCP